MKRSYWSHATVHYYWESCVVIHLLGVMIHGDIVTDLHGSLVVPADWVVPHVVEPSVLAVEWLALVLPSSVKDQLVWCHKCVSVKSWSVSQCCPPPVPGARCQDVPCPMLPPWWRECCDKIGDDLGSKIRSNIVHLNHVLKNIFLFLAPCSSFKSVIHWLG